VRGRLMASVRETRQRERNQRVRERRGCTCCAREGVEKRNLGERKVNKKIEFNIYRKLQYYVFLDNIVAICKKNPRIHNQLEAFFVFFLLQYSLL
jgi:hypothetical protein